MVNKKVFKEATPFIVAGLAGAGIWLFLRQQGEAAIVFTCPYCGDEFATQAELDEHIAIYHPTPTMYICPYCNAVFYSQAELDVHMANIHPLPSECTNGETCCEGFNLYECIGDEWVLIEQNSLQCGYVPPSECTDGETYCEGTDLYECIGGKWVLIETNSELCGVVCNPGDTKCIGTDLYRCRADRKGWELWQTNAESCGYTPSLPPPTLASVGGYVKSALTGINIAGADVYFNPETYTPGTYWVVRTGASGMFKLDNIPPGTYQIVCAYSVPYGPYQSTEFTKILHAGWNNFNIYLEEIVVPGTSPWRPW